MGVLFRSAVRMSAGELACTYAALILLGQEINEEKIKTLLSAAKVDCESYWPGLFCKAINGAEGGIDQLVTKPSGGGGGGGDCCAAGPAATGGGDAAAAKKKTTTEEEDEMAAAPADLFGGGDDY